MVFSPNMRGSAGTSIGRGGSSDHGQNAVGPEHRDVHVVVVGGGERVQDEVELAGGALDLRFVSGQHELVRAEPQSVGLLGGGGAEDGDLGPQRGRELHAHVAEAAQPDHGHPLSLPNLEATQGRVGRDARAEQRRRLLWRQPGRYLEHEALVDHGLRGVAALGHGLAVLFEAAVSQDESVLAELLEARAALGTGATGVHHASDTGGVAHLEVLDRAADRGDLPHDFVARHHRVQRHSEVVVHEVNVGVAHAAMRDVQDDVARAGVAALEAERPERGSGTRGGKSLDGDHRPSSRSSRPPSRRPGPVDFEERGTANDTPGRWTWTRARPRSSAAASAPRRPTTGRSSPRPCPARRPRRASRGSSRRGPRPRGRR